MKIYNKKVFAWGIFTAAFGVLNLIAGIINDDMDINGIILVIALFLFGFGAILRSLSQKMSREDKLEEMDERNRFIELKTKSKSFRLTQTISFSLMLILLVAGKVSGYESLIAMGAGLAFAFGVSMFTEVFTYMYYESR